MTLSPLWFRALLVSGVSVLSLLELPSAAYAASTAQARVGSVIGLNVRARPGMTHTVLKRLPNRATISGACAVRGQLIVGTQRITRQWLRLPTGGYVSDAFVVRSNNVPGCAKAKKARPKPKAVIDAIVTAPSALNVRSGPGTNYRVQTRIPRGRGVQVTCRVWGQRVNGDPIWYLLGKSGFATRVYLPPPPAPRSIGWCGVLPQMVPASNSAFLSQVASAAKQSDRAWGVPASVTIAQAILESGWGRSGLTVRDHNYFGMKCFGDPGPIAVGCATYATRECDKGRCFATRDSFRVYRTPADSFADHGRLLARSSRYSTAMRYAAQPDRFAAQLQRAGYATSPTYAAKLTGLMRQYNLYRFD